MKLNVITFLAFTCLSITNVHLFAQTDAKSKKKDIIVGVNLTGTSYYGDINYMDPQDPHASLYLGFRPGISANIGFEGPSLVQPFIQFGYGSFIAQNPDLKPEPISTGPNAIYIKPTKYINTAFLYTDLAMRFTPIRKASLIDPYLSLGIGGLYFSPKNADGASAGGLKKNKYSPIAASIPFSLGTEVRLNKRLSLNFGAFARFPLTDNMDNSGDNEYGAFNRQPGNDKLFGFLSGVNYRITHQKEMQSFAAIEPVSVQPNPALAKPASEVLPKPVMRSAPNTPKKSGSFSIPEEHKLPKNESLILATTIDIRQNPTYMALLEWKTEEPQEMPALFTEMVQTTDCDSIVKAMDFSMMNLKNENQQLRSQYTKLSQEVAKLREDNDMLVAKENALDMDLISKMPNKSEVSNSVTSNQAALRKANIKIDSLSQQISTLQLAMTSETSKRQQLQGTLDSLASIAKEKDALIAELRLGKPESATASSEKVAKSENDYALDNELMARSYQRKIDSLTSIVVRLERQYRMIKNDADILKGQKSILEDRLQQNNLQTQPQASESTPATARYEQNIDSLIKENQYLQAQVGDLRMQAERTRAENIKEIATLKEAGSIDSLLNILASKQDEYTLLYNDYLKLKQQGTSASVNPDVQERVAAMQKQVDDLLASYAEMKMQKDSYQRELENERAQKAMVTQDPAAALRILIANTQRRVDSMNTYYGAVQRRIEGYEVTINQLKDENDALNRALAEKSGGASEPVVMAVKEPSNNRQLEYQVAEYRQQVEDMGNEIQTYKTQLAEMTEKVRLILEQKSSTATIDKIEMDNRVTELEGQLKVCQNKIVELAAENDNLKSARTTDADPTAMQGAIDAMKQQIDENEVAIKQLQAENNTLRAENAQIKTDDKSVMLAEKVLTLEQEKSDLLQENIKLKKEVTGDIVDTDTQILKDQITQLKSENDALRRNAQEIGLVKVELEDMKDKYTKMEAENVGLKTELDKKTAEAMPLAQAKDLQDEVITLNEEKTNLLAQLADKSTALETANEQIKELQNNQPQPTSKNDELAVKIETLMAEREAANQKINNLESELAVARTVTPTKTETPSTTNEVELAKAKEDLSIANEKIAQLETEKAQIAEKLAIAERNTSGSNTNDDIQQLREDYAAAEKKIEGLEREKATLLAQVESLSQSGGEVAILKAQVVDLTAVVEKLEKERGLESSTAMMPDNAAQEKIADLEKERNELKVSLADANQKLAEVSANPAPTAKVDDSAETIAQLETDKKALEDKLQAESQKVADLTEELAKTSAVASTPTIAVPGSNVNVDELNDKIAGLETERQTLNAKLAQANQEIADLKQNQPSPVAANTNPMELAQLETERDALKKQLEDNTQYISNVLKEKDEAQRRAEVAEKQVELMKNTTPTNADIDKDEKIAMLNERISVLQEELATAKNSAPTAQGETDLTNKVAELERIIEQQKRELASARTMASTDGFDAADAQNREKRLAQRENYLALKEEEIRRNEAKFEYLNAKEIELKLLEQRVLGFYAIPESETHEGAPCAYTTATLDKEDVMRNIDDYFLGLGYSYTLENGKLVYSNVVVPEISNKPMNVAFYMRTSQTGKRTLQGVFRLTTGLYLTEDKYPAEYIKVIKFLQRIAQ